MGSAMTTLELMEIFKCDKVNTDSENEISDEEEKQEKQEKKSPVITEIKILRSEFKDVIKLMKNDYDNINDTNKLIILDMKNKIEELTFSNNKMEENMIRINIIVANHEQYDENLRNSTKN